jgi:hypothetical protein
MLGLLHQVSELAYTTLVYYVAFLCYYVGQQPIGSCTILKGKNAGHNHTSSSCHCWQTNAVKHLF